MAHRRYRNEILTAFHDLPAEDKRGILAIFRRFLVRRRLSVLGRERRRAAGADARTPEDPPARSGAAASRPKPRSSR